MMRQPHANKETVVSENAGCTTLWKNLRHSQSQGATSQNAQEFNAIETVLLRAFEQYGGRNVQKDADDHSHNAGVNHRTWGLS